VGVTEKDGFMPYHRYEGLDGKLKTFNSDKGEVWRRSRFCGDDRPEPYQWNFVYEVRHLPELPSGFLLVRSFDLADELYLEASEAAEKHHTSREFRLLEVERAQLFIQGMNCEPILELEDLGSLIPQGAQMPPVSDSQSEHDVLTHPEPKKYMGRIILSKTEACGAAFHEMHSSGKLLDIKSRERSRAVLNLALDKYPEFGPYIITNVHDSLGKPDLKELADLYFPRRNKSVKSTPSSGEKRQHLLDPNSPQRDEIALDRYIREQEDEMKKDRKNPIKGGRKQDL
jgi:hypothetical protein